MRTEIGHIPPASCAPAGFSIERDLPAGFAAFYRPLHDAFAERQREAIAERARTMNTAHAGTLPDYLPPSEAGSDWRIEIPDWATDQRNQMTGPADEHDLIVKMLNSGSPAVMIDLEDSMANEFALTLRGIDNAVAAYYGELTYVDAKRGDTVVGIKENPAMLWTRVRGLHLSQGGIYDEYTPASLFDLALLAFKLDFGRLRHPLAIYIPKSETAAEAVWWRDVFRAAWRSSRHIISLMKSRNSPIRCASICWA
jgi:malate synthase